VLFGPGEDGSEVTLTVERLEAATQPISAEDEKRVFDLAPALPGKRVLAWVFILAITAAFLALPIWQFTLKAADKPSPISIQAEQAWDTGEMTLAHASLSGDCQSCHVKPFQSVQDKSCLNCHDTLTNHADPKALRAVHPNLQGFDLAMRKVAGTFGKAQERCTSCHAEHNGNDGLLLTGQSFCADCHQNLSKSWSKTKLANASDFGTDHPEFRPTLTAKPDRVQPVFARMSLADAPKDNSGLKFPHDIHLSNKGGVAKMARRLAPTNPFGEVLQCKDCHTPDVAGALFQPVGMEKNCAVCHSIVFEIDNGTERMLRHGKPQDVIADMNDFYLAKALAAYQVTRTSSQSRRRPGSAAFVREADRRQRAFSLARSRTDAKIKEIFTKGGACFGCHEIEAPKASGGTDYDIQQISLVDQFLPKAKFSHVAHSTGDLECKTCHKADTSKLASDVLLPKINECRDCHGGEHPAKDKTPSTCLMCHSYHGSEHAPVMKAASR
jgi:predicted CXXCH cytochrome family protein